MKVLVTGGLGFIGSHTVVELQDQGYEVVIIDNLENSSIDVLDGITRITGTTPELYQIDLKDKAEMSRFFKVNQDVQGVIHFAANKAVGESVAQPLKYYRNNINSLVYLLEELTTLRHKNLIFSSSCTVYGEADELPITENASVKPAESPYGNTKQIGEEIIQDVCKVTSDFKAIALRYFNPIGAHHTAEIGELPIGVPQNLVPFITQTAIGLRDKLSVFGGDYPTHDGTCVRDYIHVVDLAKAHVVALQRLTQNAQQNNFEIFNLGTGKGSSVLQVVESFERISGKKLNYEVVGRRAGDVVAAYAETSKAKNILGWQTKLSLDDAMASAWKWEQKIRV